MSHIYIFEGVENKNWGDYDRFYTNFIPTVTPNEYYKYNWPKTMVESYQNYDLTT